MDWVRVKARAKARGISELVALGLGLPQESPGKKSILVSKLTNLVVTNLSGQKSGRNADLQAGRDIL